ncbi:Ubiquinol-cytochrome C chaperone [Parvibaculum lavamentivorans DS-1]|uniref:Ubiquinol-cytochrome C chaperone n=1 Tax=Parvibaculum lavamentivorans (strain DS-1 / DSM 13023 / NCIMB 13966) TaxID=402881 RepID=A7HX94_PARL1|nr:ubiquinol-cytochrome C chaperone family protein [Parvibaculum lavamentivorans]ABS64527.1 Ubiquinol-cytochrome C chaperone [Parvibaculum lavamentivorans DS-1]
MIWRNIFGRSPRDETPYALYAGLVAQARSPQFYLHMNVPDTAEGRFEMVALHAFLVLRKLRSGGEEGKALGQKVFDILFDDMDQTLREMGVGDLSVGKKIKALASSFYGRIQAYEEGLGEAAGERLRDALRRNLYGGLQVRDEQVSSMEDYVRRADRALLDQPIDDVMAGRAVFASPPDVTSIEADLTEGELR